MSTESAIAGKKIVLGVCGTIAAYKSVELCRRLVQQGALVTPVLTEDATRFVGEVTFSAVAGERAHTSLWDDANPIPHTQLGQWADLIVIAPASADFIGKYTHGLANDLLSATLLATRAPVVVCPSMHSEMWEHPAVQDNMATLRHRGVRIVEPEIGELAGGDVGAGRFPDAQTILDAINTVFTPQDFQDLSVIVTAGGTREPIDSVRYLTNRSSGKQGHAIANEAATRGAKTVLVTTASQPVAADVEVIRVDTAQQMAEAVFDRASSADVVIMAAAVADYQPANVSDIKLKKSNEQIAVTLEPTVDILAELSLRRTPQQFIVGFAAEDRNVIDNAKKKLQQKQLDLVVANDISEPGSGFDSDTNHATIISSDGDVHEIRSTKRDVASALLDTIAAKRKA